MDPHTLRDLFPIPSDYRVDKVCDLEHAVRTHVAPGMTLHFGYNQARAMAISNALVRTFSGTRPEFTIVSAGLVASQTALLSNRLVKRLEVSFAGENYPAPSPNRIMQEALNSGDVQIENQSLLVISQRLAAGAFGFPFALTRSFARTSLALNESYAAIADPFGSGERVGAVRALVPDVTFIHGIAADAQGNVLLSPPHGEGEIAAFAARKGVIASVEKIVSPEVIRQFPLLARVPAHRVLSVSEAPMGCHPYGLYAPRDLGIPGYVEDYEAFMELREALAARERFEAWTEKWILGPRDHGEYVQKLGADRIEALRGGALEGSWESELDHETLQTLRSRDDHDDVDAMIVTTAHVLEDRVRQHGYGVVAAGVGYANLAAWLAVANLQRDGLPTELVAEIGLYGYSPRPGEPFIFSNRNISTCKSLTTSEAVLGLYVSGRHNDCLAVIGAGQIDQSGNINSTYDANGGFLVGSGGANDICSAAREVIAVTRMSRARLVKRLPYVTSSGHAVSTLVTDLGVFEKRDGKLLLKRILAPGSDALERIRDRCGWELETADCLIYEPPPAPEDLLRLRLYDPRGEFLARRD